MFKNKIYHFFLNTVYIGMPDPEYSDTNTSLGASRARFITLFDVSNTDWKLVCSKLD